MFSISRFVIGGSDRSRLTTAMAMFENVYFFGFNNEASTCDEENLLQQRY